VKVLGTLLYVSVAWLFFFEKNLHLTISKIQALITPAAYAGSPLTILDRAFPTSTEVASLAALWGLAAVFFLLEWPSRDDDEPYGALRSIPASIVLVALTVLLAPMQESTFIYFNF
jgi:hypothetical protein